MKPQDSVRLATAIAPAAMISPPLAILAALVGVGVLWLLSEDSIATESNFQIAPFPPTPKSPT